jgi:hypothetical protein
MTVAIRLDADSQETRASHLPELFDILSERGSG